MKVLRLLLASLVLVAFSFALSPVVVAAASFDLFGDATLISPGHNSNTAAQLRSNVSGSGLTFGGANLSVPAGMTVNQLTNLATDYMFTAASCGRSRRISTSSSRWSSTSRSTAATPCRRAAR